MLVQYLDDDVTPLDGFIFPDPAQAGQLSDPVEVHIKNEGLTVARNVAILMRTRSLEDPNLFIAVGVPPQDQQWGRVRIVGFDNSGDPTWTVANTDQRVIGARSFLLLGDIPAGCTVFYEFAVQPPSIAQENTWTSCPVFAFDEFSQPCGTELTAVMRGIVHGIGDYSRTGVVRGLGLTVSGSPDDEVHTEAGFILDHGKLVGIVATDHTLNQNDGAAAALASGESYWAVRKVVNGVLSMVKGNKGTPPVKPTPAGLIKPYIQVLFNGGGSVIEEEDLDEELLYDRYLMVAGTGLNLDVHPGFAVGGGTFRYSAGKQQVPLADDDVSYIWQLASGLFQDTLDEIAPEDTATGPWAEVTTASGAITNIAERRTYAGETFIIHLRGTPVPGAPGELDSQIVQHEKLVVEQVMARVSDNGGGSSGDTVLDTEVDGTTIYTSFATDDQRPTFAFDAAGDDLVHGTGVHEVTMLRRGQKLALVSTEYPDSDAYPPAVAEAWYLCRLP